MEITYIVGNGLDIQYGLPTGYRDFYEYQASIYTVEKEIGRVNYIYEALFADSVNEYENWSDFELFVGQLTKDDDIFITDEVNREKFLEDFIDVIDDLRDYLKLVEEKFVFNDRLEIGFKATLSNLMLDVPKKNVSQISTVLKSNWIEDDHVNILTLNYTSVFDKLFKQSETSFYNMHKNNNYRTYIREPIHVHGLLSFGTILGVNDHEQISDRFSEAQREDLIKSKIISSYRENWEVRNEGIIKQSKIIVLYGVSIGATDKYLWNQIAKHSLSNGVPIIIYHYVKNFDAGNPLRVKRLYKAVEDKFINNCGMDSSKEKELRENIITVVGKTIFNLVDEGVKE